MTMGKRSDFERVPRDYYPTPIEAVAPLVPHLIEAGVTFFDEPCAGDGRLIDHLEAYGFKCFAAFDIEPRRDDIAEADVLETTASIAQCFITNPPWDRKLLHPLIERITPIAPSWLLIDADWMHTRQSAPYMKWCRKIISVGRVKWIEGTNQTGKDNTAWYLFDQNATGATEFVGR